ncbi:hypothetical protein [Stenotrophomonas sp. B1-1]|uniref:hypothetical protein n=1 Tax=Stenotrophomonas sp. B1-1 TaxID=2710648 RepID=UPI0013DD58D5|nr:hypothetical protein [Stenotrophomonas sp. B1-1]
MIGTREEAAPIDSRDAFALSDRKVELSFLAKSADFKAKTTERAVRTDAQHAQHRDVRHRPGARRPAKVA